MSMAGRMKALPRGTEKSARGGRPSVQWGRVILAALAALAACPSPALAMPDEQPRAGVPTWHLGEGLAEGDSFTYRLCAGHALPSIASRCVTAHLEFVAVLDEWHGPVWVVQARFGVPGEPGPGQDAILRIGAEGMLEVSADARHGAMVSAMRETLLWIDAHAGRHEPRGMAVGEAWGDGAGSLHVLTVGVEDVGGAEAEVASVGYPGRPGTLVRVADGFPFPLDARVYARLGPIERLALEVDLVAHSRGAPDGGHAEPGPAPGSEGEAVSETELLVASDTRGAAEAIGRACGEADGTQGTVAELCGGSGADLAWEGPWGAGWRGMPGPEWDVHGVDWREACSGSLLERTCYRGVVTSADGATLGIDGVPTRLSLVRADPGDGAASLLLSECEPGSWVTVDIDDAMPIDAAGAPVAAVHCGGEAPVNAALVGSDHASVDGDMCASSEFALHEWAVRGCGG